MATIGVTGEGFRRILFYANDGSRKSITIGKATEKQATAFKVKIESLISASITGSMDDETARWLAERDDKIYARIAEAGLVKPRVASGKSALGPFIDSFLAGKTGMKEHTRLNWIQVRKWLVKHFGEARDMKTITANDAEEWRTYLLTAKLDEKKKSLGENTIRRHIGRARQLFKAAIRRGIVRGANPFEDMAATVRADKARMHFVTRDDIAKVIATCPNAEWKLMVVLTRYGGLRCPSETLALKWADIDWQNEKIRVPSPKTEHHKGKDFRWIPLFPELRQPLLDAAKEAEPGTTYVISRYRDKYTNLRTHFIRIITKAGLKAWAKPWHNMRSSRQTELAETHPIHVVCAWMGNSRAIAMEHYLQVTDEHFRQAAEQRGTADAADVLPAVLYRAETSRKGREMVGVGTNKTADLPRDTDPYDTLHLHNYPRQDSNL